MGTPGHMAHPFDVDKVKTGQDLIDYINDAVLRLQNQEIAGSVKWDGINTSFKLVTKKDGGKDFRMDRGTNHTDSVVGLTADDAYAKWPEGHGMPPAIEKLLNIFNTALPLIEPELKELRMWDDPTKYFNTEYIEGKSNVQEYAANILAIHGINQFYEKKAQPHAIRKGTSMDRPGLPRPIDPATDKPIKGGGIEIPYNKEALISLIEKVQPIAQKSGFEVYGDVPVEFDPDIELDLEKVLDTPLSIQVVPGGIETAPLREWLKDAQHPYDTKVIKADGKSVGALSKDIYMAVLRSATDAGIPLSQYLESQEDVKDAISGAVMYHGTRLLGQAVKNSLRSQAGSVGRHEGVVLRGMEDFLVKLTGDFIVQGLESTHGKQEEMLKESPLYWARELTYTESIITEESRTDKPAIAIYPGRFQPMGRHHFQTYQAIADQFGLKNTFVATSDASGPKSPLTFEEKKTIMLAHGIPESQIVKTRSPYQPVEITNMFDPGSTSVVFAVGSKDMKDNPRFANLDGMTKMGAPAYYKTYFPDQEMDGLNKHGYMMVAPHVDIDIPGYGEMSGTTLRKALKGASPEDFEKIMGWFNQDIYDMLQQSLQESASPMGALTGLMDAGLSKINIFSGRREDDEEELDEISAMAVGSVQGGAIGTGSKKGPWSDFDAAAFNKRQKKDSRLRGAKEFIAEEEELVNEVVDYLLGITVG